ncbi:MAG: YXWGXW repeat-containing protein [Aliidongia sp.]
MTNHKQLSLKKLLLAATMLVAPAALIAGSNLAIAQIDISVQIEPPALPVYDQPPIPEPGYIWTPGYWAYDNDEGYYWIPGTWVEPPQPNLLWTPPYWGWSDGVYAFHSGYWGEHVGFYGGVNYGYGYGGDGYEGGRWENGRFAYNQDRQQFRLDSYNQCLHVECDGDQQHPCQLRRRHGRSQGPADPGTGAGRARAPCRGDAGADTAFHGSCA